jgi:YesN/AraC family two-component response regulator
MKKILVAEDELHTRNIFKDCLEAEGFEVVSAENGQIAVQQVHAQLPDLVLCDIIMPKLDGYGVLEALRQNPETASTPFIFLTAKSTKVEVRQGMELGADDYLTKPSTAEELLRAIEARLERQEKLKQWCVHEFQQAQPSPHRESSSSSSIFPSIPQFSAVFEFIEANYTQSISLNDVAQAVEYSPAYLTNLIRRQTGRSLYQWIIERRMTAACSLLLETRQTVEQIAIAVGYQDAGHFSRQFRQSFGMSPKSWKHAHQ